MQPRPLFRRFPFRCSIVFVVIIILSLPIYIFFWWLLLLFLSIWSGVCFRFASTFDTISLPVAKVTRLVFTARRRDVPRPVFLLSSGRWHMQSMCSSNSYQLAVGDCQLPGRKCGLCLSLPLSRSLCVALCVPHQLQAHVTCIML